MAVFDQPVTTYSDSTPQKRAITDVISLIDPTDVPLVTAIGGLDGAASKFRFINFPQTTVEWLEDTHAPLTDALNESATVTSTVTTLTVGDASYYEAGYVLAIDSELLWVSSAATATQILTVTRGVAGSTAATHDSLAAVAIVGIARLEGAESSTIALTDRTIGSNVTQIFHQEVKVTRSHGQLSQYGIPNEMGYQRDKAVPQVMRLVEKHILRSKGASAGSATTPRIMNGIQGFVTTNKVSGATLTQAKIESAVKLAYTYGGAGPWLAVVSPSNKQKIKNFYDTTGTASTTILRVGRDETTVGMNVERIVTPFGEVNLLLDRHAEDTIIPLLDLNHVGLLTYFPFSWEPLAKTGDYERQEVVAELTFCLRQEKAHAILTAVS